MVGGIIYQDINLAFFQFFQRIGIHQTVTGKEACGHVADDREDHRPDGKPDRTAKREWERGRAFLYAQMAT